MMILVIDGHDTLRVERLVSKPEQIWRGRGVNLNDSRELFPESGWPDAIRRRDVQRFESDRRDHRRDHAGSWPDLSRDGRAARRAQGRLLTVPCLRNALDTRVSGRFLL